MFAVMNCIKKSLPASDRKLDILVIQQGHNDYINQMAQIPNCNIYSYHNNLQQERKRGVPRNLFVISDLDSIIIDSFDFIICIGRTNSAIIANELKKRFSCRMILIDEAAESTYFVRPFGIPLNNTIDVKFDKHISLNKYINKNIQSIPLIGPPERESNIIENKSNNRKFCFSSEIDPSIFIRYRGVLNGLEYENFSEEAISKNNIFIETHIGISPYLISALKYGCFVICPHSEEIESMIGGDENLGFIYKDLIELRGYIDHLKSVKELPKRSNKLFREMMSKREEFKQAWNTILRN